MGASSLEGLKTILSKEHVKSVFLVTGKSSYELCGAKDLLALPLFGIEVTRFSDFEINPRLEDLSEGIRIFNSQKYDLIVAIGGGSVLDMAKAIKGLHSYSDNLAAAIITGKESNKTTSLVAIPTTAGTGSEATHFAVIYISGEKYSFSSLDLLPEYVILSPRLTESVPQYDAACAGADALCQSIESLWARSSTKSSRSYAKKALALIWPNIKGAVVEQKSDAKARMLEGAYWAGRAINISKTTASHALSYKITSRFKIPHGHAVALTLIPVIRHNYEADSSNCENLFRALSVTDLPSAIFLLQELWAVLGLKMSLEELGVEKSEIENLSNCNKERLNNNPAVLHREQIINILESIY
ncbi:phosphonoacetaldehyde reductase [Akkermansiaceae bacterium]|nr:phosphonoacetaldehyde reductase [Akkermansiaceae bacterium]